MKKFLPVFMFFLSMLFFTSCDCDRDLTLNILSNNNVDVTVDTTKVTDYATEATLIHLLQIPDLLLKEVLYNLTRYLLIFGRH